MAEAKPIHQISQLESIREQLHLLDANQDGSLAPQEIDADQDGLLDLDVFERTPQTKQLNLGQRSVLESSLYRANLVSQLRSSLGIKSFLLQDLPGRDLVEILNWRYDNRMQSFWDPIHKLYQQEHPVLGYQKFIDEIKTWNSEKILALIERYASADNFDEHTFRDVKTFIEGSEFQRHHESLRADFSIEKAKAPFYELYSILKQDPNSQQRYLSALRSKEFTQFVSFIEEKYQISAQNKLTLSLDAYLSPRTLQHYKSPDTQEAFFKIREAFPKADFDSLLFVELVERVISNDFEPQIATSLRELLSSGRYEQKLLERKRQFDIFTQDYQIPIQSYWDFEKLFHVSQQEFEICEQAESQATWVYLKKNYPEKMARFENLSGFFAYPQVTENLFEPINKHDTTAESVDMFLKIFNRNLGEINDLSAVLWVIKKSKKSNFGKISEDKKFAEFVQTLFKKYPSFKNSLEPGQMGEIYYAFFEQRKDFDALNQAIQNFNEQPIPELNFEDSELKIEILSEFKRQALNLVILKQKENSSSTGVDWGYDANHLDLLKKALADGSAAQLYNVLKNDWHLSQIEFDKFVSILADTKDSEFFLNPENAKKYLHLETLYSLKKQEPQKQNGQEARSLDEIRYTKNLVDHYDFFTSTLPPQLLESYFPFLKKDEGYDGYNLEKLYKLSTLKPETLKKLISSLESFGLSAVEIGSMLYSLDGKVEKLLEQIQDSKFINTFEKLKSFYTGKTKEFVFMDKRSVEAMGNSDYFSFAFLLKDFPNATSVLRDLEKIGVQLSSWEELNFVAQQILPQKDMTTALSEANFQKFFQQITATFYDGKRSLEILPEIAVLYKRFKDRPPVMRLLFSDPFKQVLSFVRTRFNITDLDPATLEPLLQIASNFDHNKVEALITKLEASGEKLSANDLIFLVEISKSEALTKKLFDRRELIQDLQALVATQAYPRPLLDEIASLIVVLENTKRLWGEDDPKVTKLKEEIEQKQKTYSERPALEELSNLQLLRLHLLWHALQQAQTLKTLGKIVSDDLADPKTEHGGNILFHEGNLHFNNVHSVSEFNGAYGNTKYNFFTAGMATFHLHATQVDDRKYSGPSGWLGASGGDIPAIDHYGQTGVVITTMGRLPNDILRINVDMYYIEEKQGEKVLRIIDLGEFNIRSQGP